MSEIINRLNELRKVMKEKNVQAYVVCTEDFHGSEYVGDYFKTREYLSGFTGSAGTLVVLEDKAALWTDGRYFIQAENQLKNSTIELMKVGEKGVKSIPEYLYNELIDGATIGFDGRTVSNIFVENVLERFDNKNVYIKYDEDLVDKIWKDRPKLSAEKVFMLDNKYSGETTASKFEKIKEYLSNMDADKLIVTKLDEIAWFLNLRGNDINCCPLFLSYLIIENEKCDLYINEYILSEDIKKYLLMNKVNIHSYNDFYADLSKQNKEDVIILDMEDCNYSINSILEKHENIIDEKSEIEYLKAIKNPVEMENERRAHIKDGVAVTKFIYYLKKNAGKITELDAAKELEKFRMAGDGVNETGYIEPSFEPIIAYAEHGAIVHYSATEETNALIGNKGLLLADTGGHYYEGTTDITRTIAMGPVSNEEKEAFTTVLKGNLNLGAAKFLYGVTGKNLDAIARGPLWKQGLNYNHGTGHGVGYLLNVHEGPNCFRWQKTNAGTENTVFEEGMITSNEPGYYLEGKFGIRHENLILCREIEENEYGKFMGFETLTMVPFDIEAIDVKLLNDYEINLLNDYHKKVFENISKYFDGEELEWLKNATKPLNALH